METPITVRAKEDLARRGFLNFQHIGKFEALVTHERGARYFAHINASRVKMVRLQEAMTIDDAREHLCLGNEFRIVLPRS